MVSRIWVPTARPTSYGVPLTRTTGSVCALTPTSNAASAARTAVRGRGIFEFFKRFQRSMMWASALVLVDFHLEEGQRVAFQVPEDAVSA